MFEEAVGSGSGRCGEVKEVRYRLGSRIRGVEGCFNERTIADYEWALSHHLLPFFREHRLDAITVEEVDRYKAAKLREGRLGASQLNKTLKRLSQILEVAEEYEYIARNPARGKRRRVKAPKTRRSWVEPERRSR